jgi:hypothetical protein
LGKDYRTFFYFLIMPALDAGIFFLGSGEDDRIKSGHDEK